MRRETTAQDALRAAIGVTVSEYEAKWRKDLGVNGNRIGVELLACRVFAVDK